jgi:hypothetical protein
MRNNDGTPATMDLQGAITTIGFMCELLKVLGVGDVPENTFWTARGLLEKYEEAIIAAEREACAKISEQSLGGYLCPYGRDKRGDPTWNHTDKDKCPICGFDGEGSLAGCHDNVQARIAKLIRNR